MELVSACLRKWHARVHWRVLADVEEEEEEEEEGKKMGKKKGQLYFSRDYTVHVCVRTFPHGPDTLVSSLLPAHRMDMARGLGLARARVHAFLSVKVVK